MSAIKLQNCYWSVALVSLVLGLILAVQYRNNMDVQQNEAIRRTNELANQVEQMKKEHDVLQGQLNRMLLQLEDLSTGIHGNQIKEEMEQVKIFAGMTKLTGSGVEVTLKDSNISKDYTENPNLYIVHDEDILRVVNELKAAGAEAIAVNDQRLITTTGIRCSGSTIKINKEALVPPFVITAIGNPETLEGALKMRGGVAEYFQFFGIQVSVKKEEELEIPAYSSGIKSNYMMDADA